MIWRTGKPAEAISLADRESLHRAVVLCESGKMEDAGYACEALLRRVPSYTDARHLLGVIRSGQGHFEEAIKHFDQVLSLEPKNAVGHHNRGLAQLALNRADDAIADFERALVLKPEFSAALCSLANALAGLRRYDEALVCYDGVLQSDARHWEALNNRGNVLAALGRYAEAIQSYESASSAAPANAAAHFNIGLAWFAMTRYAEAVLAFDRALERDGRHVHALKARGDALSCLRRNEEAAASYAAAAAIDPDLPFIEGAVLHGKMQRCDWTEYQESVERIVRGVTQGRAVTVPFVLLSICDDPFAQRRCAEIYARHLRFMDEPALGSSRPRNDGKIRLAYVSSKFHDHAGARLIAELLEIHDRRRFEIIGVSFGPDAKGGMRERLRRSFDQFLDVRERSDSEVAAMLRELGIDIAVDLVGFTDSSRLGIFGYRAAPVQVSFLGCPGTTGAEYIDYIIGDHTVIPAGDEAYYTECVVRMPDSYQVNDSKRCIGEGGPTRMEAGLPENSFVLCCFNNPSKITPVVFDVWMRVLRRFGDTVLWLMRSNSRAEGNLRREAAARGVDPARLVFAPHAPLAEHLARHRLADLFVDTLPYNAHVTASDALWTGLPLITCAGRSFASRVAGSLLKSVGLPELITSSLDKYEARLCGLLDERHELRILRARLQQNIVRAPLFDTDRFRMHLEAAYIAMFETRRRGEPPKAFNVPGIVSPN